MVACECEVHVAVGRAAACEALKRWLPSGNTATGPTSTPSIASIKGAFRLEASVADGVPGLLWHVPNDHRRPRLDDARLLASDRGKRVAEVLLVIEGDGGDRARHRR